jgi:pantothenate synthetase
LREPERAAAPSLYRALVAMSDAVTRGETNRDRIVAAGRAQIVAPLREAYLDIVVPETFEAVPDIVLRQAQDKLASREFVGIGSAWLGTTRIIDNVPLTVPAVPANAVLHASVSS